MTTALEAMEQAQTAGKPEEQKPTDGEQKPAGSEAEASPPVTTPSFETAQGQVEANEAAARKGEVDQLKQLNRDLILNQFPEDMRPGVKRVLDLKEEAGYVQSEREKIDVEKHGMARDRVLAEYKDAGVTADHLKHCPDEAAMKEMAESIKALKGEGKGEGEGETKNPGAMKENPSTATPGAAGGAKPAAEQFKRTGVEAGLTGLLSGWQSGEAQ